MQTIVIEHVTKKYPTLLANDDINLTIQSGEVIGLIGENGAGKSTLIKQILGIIASDEGQISILGQTPGSHQNQEAVSAMQQEDLIIRDVRVIDILKWAHGVYKQPLKITDVLTLTNLNTHKKHLLSELSGGQLRRLNFGLAIIGQPKVLLLDEPTVAMDVINRNKFWNYIRQLKEKGTTIIVTSHYLDEIADIADRLVILKKGRVTFDGTLHELQTQVGETKISFKGLTIWLDKFKNDKNIKECLQKNNEYQLHVQDSNLWIQKYSQEITVMKDLRIEATSLTEIYTDMIGD